MVGWPNTACILKLSNGLQDLEPAPVDSDWQIKMSAANSWGEERSGSGGVGGRDRDGGGGGGLGFPG